MNRCSYIEIAPTIRARTGEGNNDFIMERELQPINTDNDGNARTITTHYNDMNEDSISGNSEHGYKRTAVLDNYRIRKLTPRECFRLMDVSDEDIDKIQAAGISNSQRYKMAGNSIVVGVLENIFDKLLINTEITEPNLFNN